MRALTGEQERAVARRHGSVLLSAAAGSGKTSVLVERFVRAVCQDGISPGRILAITFTERAAAELKHRVRVRLRELGERDFALDTESAFVSTFHSFCARLLRTHPLAADVSPGFQIIERASSARLQRLAFRGALSWLMEREGERAVDLLAAYGPEPLRALTLETYGHLRSHGELAPRLPRALARISVTAASRELRASIPEATAELRVAFARRPGRRLEDGLAALERAQELTAQANWETPPGPPSPAVLSALGLPGSGGLGGRACEAYRLALARCVEACADYLGVKDCALLDSLLGAFGERYSRLVQGRGGLDFDDLELRAGALLAGQEDVRRSWSERFELLMVDEFQDTNARQLAILSALDRDNLFTVGDELQSIYSFREADVEIFRRRRAELQGRGGCLELTGNFRARAPLIAAVNAVFSERFGALHSPLVAVREESPSSAQEPRIELLLADSGPVARGGSAGPQNSRAWRVAEAALLAGRLSELLAGGEVQAGEVAVLLRATGELPIYERALQEHGLNTSASAGRFWEGQQVGDLLCYLGAVANPYDELALCGTLASPLVGLSSDGLVELVTLARQRRADVWDLIATAGVGGVDGLRESDRLPLRRFGESLQRERASAPWRSVAELIERALDWSGYRLHVLSLAGAERRMANVHKLVRLARRFGAAEGPGLREFLDHVEQLRASPDSAEADAAVAVGESEAVRLMSIHAAKGLEFPVVCLADLGRTPRPPSTPALLLDGDRLGLRVAMLDGSAPQSSLSWDELRRERRCAEAEEEERILYVGMTRASERLILSGAVDFSRWPKPGPGVAPIAWIVPALLQELPTLEEAPRPALQELACRDARGVAVRCLLSAGQTGCDAHRDAPATDLGAPGRAAPARPGTEQAPPGQAAPQRAPVEPARVRGREPLQADLRCAEGAMVGSTLSYTALSELERCGYRFYLERVLGLAPERGGELEWERGALGARERGTIVHALLERADFSRGRSPSGAEVQATCVGLGLSVSPADRQQIAALVQGACQSELARRLGRMRELRREYPFLFSLGANGRLLSGVMDVVAREAQGTLIVDYKSDPVGGSEDLSKRVERDYGAQRLIYALAALRAGAPEVEVVHWFLARPDQPVHARFHSSEQESLVASLSDRIARAEARGPCVSAQPHRALCAQCPGRAGLCSWPATETSRELPLGSPGDGRI